MKWLHISDIHFNYKGYDSANLKSKLLDKLTKMNLQLDFILISGDCLYKYNANQTLQNDLIKFVKKIGKICGCPKGRIYICPGNHDVNRHDGLRNDLINDIREGKKDFSEEYNYLCELGIEKFQKIYRGVTGKDYLSYSVHEPKDSSFRIVSINTCLTSKDKADMGKLQVCNEQLLRLNSKIHDDNKINILLMHHGLDSFTVEDSKRFSHWIDDNHIDIIFSGHTHRAALGVLDDTYREIKQITAGAIMIDDYALPSFYLCEFDNLSSKLVLKLYAYTTNQDDWVEDNCSLRKFKDGICSYYLPRTAHQNVNRIANLDDIFDAFNTRYKNKYNSTKIHSNKFEGEEEFNSWKIVNSLVNIGMPYQKALLITDCVIDEITKSDFVTSHHILSCFELRSVVYQTILRYEPQENETCFEVSCWASKYARKYYRNKEILVISPNGKTEKLNYSYIKNEILHRAFVSITGVPYYYLKVTSKELCIMAEAILSFLKNMEIFEIQDQVVLGLVIEYMTQKPHPWLVNNNRDELIKYHKGQAEKHIKQLQRTPMIVSQLEAAYHVCAAFMVMYDEFVGAEELSPIVSLTNAVNWIYDEEKFESNKIPMLRHRVVQLKKDLEVHGIAYCDFRTNLNVLMDNIVRERNVTNAETRNAIIRLWNFLIKLEGTASISKQFDGQYASIQTIWDLFNNATGFVAKAQLRALPNGFWFEPYWEKYESIRHHLGNNILVCVLDNLSDVDGVFNYCFSSDNPKECGEIVFVMSDFSDFSSDERIKIRKRFEGYFVRCIFIQERDFYNISECDDWRQAFYDIVVKSRIS